MVELTKETAEYGFKLEHYKNGRPYLTFRGHHATAKVLRTFSYMMAIDQGGELEVWPFCRRCVICAPDDDHKWVAEQDRVNERPSMFGPKRFDLIPPSFDDDWECVYVFRGVNWVDLAPSDDYLGVIDRHNWDIESIITDAAWTYIEACGGFVHFKYSKDIKLNLWTIPYKGGLINSDLYKERVDRVTANRALAAKKKEGLAQ